MRPGHRYGRSKRLAEEVAAEIHESGRLEVTVVRPGVVYGERDRLFVPNLARVLRLPVVPVMGRGDNTVPVVYAGNLAAGVAAALDGRGSGNAFNLAVDHPLTQRELLEGLAHGLGRSPALVSIPADLIRMGARLAEAAGLFVPGMGRLSAARAAHLMLGENPYTLQRARDQLGWRPSVRHETALRRTGQRLLHHKEIPMTES
jgi:nucleoside-diphosphate-sugar epimerase